MADDYVYKISSCYIQTWLRYDTKHVKNRHFHVISGLYRDFRFFTDFDVSKIV